MFEKTLTDVVKGIRASKRDTVLYISQCIAEIKTEINSSDMFVKANALQKLTFLQMMGYSMNWASFATIEVMSSPRFAHKRIGYLAAEQGFTQDTEVILLTTNLLQKELRGAVGGGMHGVYEAGLAINCLSNIVTEDLARDLLPDLTNLLSHAQPYIRKKAVLCLFKLFVKYPQGLRLTFNKVQELLKDPNPSVVSCAVNVITELSDKNPRNYLHLAPSFFQLLTSSSNNWMLIKVVKLLGSLVPEEPRLARKLLGPLSDIVKSTQAKSLLFESVYTITLCLPYCRKSDGSMPESVPELVRLCAQTLGEFVGDDDQNLKYLGLVGFGSLMQSHPKVLSSPEYRTHILSCLSDEDVTIRTRALDLLSGMASRKNLVELVSQLLKHVEQASGTYKHDLVAKIVELCSGDKYALLQDFEWFFDVLLMLGHMRGIDKHASLLRTQVTDVALRVLPAREYAVKRSMDVLLEGESTISEDLHGDNGRGKHLTPEILPALSWIVGEYSDLIDTAVQNSDIPYKYDENSVGAYHSIIQALTNPLNTTRLPSSTVKVYIQNAMKVFAAAASSKKTSDLELEASLLCLCSNIPVYVRSCDVEVLERSYSSLKILDALDLLLDPSLTSPVIVRTEEKSSLEHDLLGMVQKTPILSTESSPTTTSPVTRIRDASALLNYALKPSPMKPSGIKAQRKKRQSPKGITCNLDEPARLSIFSDIIEEEINDRSSKRLTLDAVSFTQQKPVLIEERPAETVRRKMDFVSSDDFSLTNNIDGAPSFQHQKGIAASSPGPQRVGDPFYLNSAPHSDDEKPDHDQSRFGTIQLLDSDGEMDHVDEKRSRKKSKKKKHRKAAPEMGDIWGGDQPQSKKEIAIYHSDEDESERQSAGTSRLKGNEFADLAKVDLTTPLREDEVMPERKHREVPERKYESPKKSTKKAKKKKKSRSGESSTSNAVGDLLNFNSHEAQGSLLNMDSSNVNSIHSAFDDLLSLPVTSMPTPPSTISDSFKQSSAKSKRPWIAAQIKSSGGKGNVDWASIVVAVKIFSSKTESDAVDLVIKVENHSKQTLEGVSITLHGNGLGEVSFGPIVPGAKIECSKTGPILFTDKQKSLEVKGSILVSTGSAPMKIRVPPIAFLNPDPERTMEDIASELSSGQWFSNSAKISLQSPSNSNKMKDLLMAYFRASEVTRSSMDGNFTLSSKHTNGTPVRVLVKTKLNSIKVDVKSTSAGLSEALASEVRKLLLD